MRILFISSLSPYPVHGGGSQRSHLVCRALQRLGEVDLVLAGQGGESTEGLHDHFPVAAVRLWRQPGAHFPFNLVLPFHSRLANLAALALRPKRLEYRPDANAAPVVRRLLASNKYDLVVSRYLRATMKSGCLGWGGPTILDLDDVDSHVYRSRIHNPRLPRYHRIINRRHFHEAEQLQRDLLPLFDLVWVPNPQVEGLEFLERKTWLPNIPFPREESRQAAGASPLPEPVDPDDLGILFVGSLAVAPNFTAVDHFVRAVWPAVHASEPRARFRIYGPGLRPEHRARWAAVPGVEPIGFVEDLASAYAGCRFAVAPILSGSGTNIKVLECFAYGRTCVVSQFAHAPFADVLRDGESLRAATSDDAFAAACVDLLRDGRQRTAFAARGREVVQQHFSLDAFNATVAESVAEVMARHRRDENRRRHDVSVPAPSSPPLPALAATR